MNALDFLPVDALPAEAIDGVFTDLDDTLTTDGRLNARTYAALEALAESGVRVVPVTGRSAGWCDLIVRLWPVAAVIGETGAFCMVPEGGHVRRLMMQDADSQAATAQHRDRIAARVLDEAPGVQLAADQPYRLVDLAIDIAENVAPLPAGQIQRIVTILRDEGMQAQPSSIHVNGWFGRFDKGSSAIRLLTEHWGIPERDARQRWVCIGDAPNDASLFSAFEHSVGVANLLRHRPVMTTLPRYLTASPHGEGFAELSRHLIRSRAG